MKLTHASKTLLAGVALLGTLSLTACDNDDTAKAGDSPSGAKPTASADAGQGGGASGGGSGGSGSAGEGSGKSGTGEDDGGVDTCRSDALEVTAADNTTDKTEGVITVQFKNGGGRDCSLNGYAGVDLKTATGDTLSVDRNGDQAHPAVLKDGESAAFNLTFPLNTTGGSGVRVAHILVTPPNETKTVTIAWPAGSLPVSGEDTSANNPKPAIGPVGKVSDSPAG
ncbi:DUF4232 domain-containing protein [Streptomyces sp. WAC 01529]|uniref:DUF4232 domain-containing protein n=1 Tax=Streptomyces sp. WAC 01529 TaxID=2203205 RepID=UPI000F6CEA87|nr:DUF4232 domain-containing protein [Streptomyces sp. WAC 01529]AZM54089.1 DUF4232 domain-containing protein [Streptomyces sp. WAC 01529]